MEKATKAGRRRDDDDEDSGADAKEQAAVKDSAKQRRREKAVEAAEQAAPDPGDAMTEGVKLCYKLLVDVLGKENVEIIDPIGEPFDPNEHQAMSMVENPEMEPNSVFAVVQKGYKLNGRLVRAAMVMVTRAPAPDSEEPESSS